jgi:uncharacterized protein (AIM24 family)
MTHHSLGDLINKTKQSDKGQGTFELEGGDRFLEINLSGKMWMSIGSMVAYHGNIKFKREGAFEHGMKKFFKSAFTGEGMVLTKAEGEGGLYLAKSGKKITVIKLEGDDIVVNGNDVLAFEETIEWDIKMMKKISSIASGGLFNVRLSGYGLVAIATHHDPITLSVLKDRPLMTDTGATVAWSGNLSPDFKTDINLKTIFGRSSGETFQMKFEGEGFVIIQSFEEMGGR